MVGNAVSDTGLGQLQQADLIRADRLPDVAGLARRGRRIRNRRRWQRAGSPLGFYIPLLDPERLLNATARFVTPLFSRWGLALWLAAVLGGLLLLARHWSGMTANFADQDFGFVNNSVAVYDIDHAALIGGGAGPLFLKSNVNLSGLVFTRAKFGGATLTGTIFSESRLGGADFTKAQFDGTQFQGTDLTGATLPAALGTADFSRGSTSLSSS